MPRPLRRDRRGPPAVAMMRGSGSKWRCLGRRLLIVAMLSAAGRAGTDEAIAWRPWSDAAFAAAVVCVQERQACERRSGHRLLGPRQVDLPVPVAGRPWIVRDHRRPPLGMQALRGAKDRGKGEEQGPRHDGATVLQGVAGRASSSRGRSRSRPSPPPPSRRGRKARRRATFPRPSGSARGRRGQPPTAGAARSGC